MSATYRSLQRPGAQDSVLNPVRVRYAGRHQDQGGDYHSYQYELPGKKVMDRWRSASSRPVHTVAQFSTNDTANGQPIVTNVSGIFRINEISDVRIGSIGSNIRFTDNIINIRDDLFYKDFDPVRVTRRFYSWFHDDYDFLNIIWGSPYHRNRSHITVQNKVEGIGKPVGGWQQRLGSKDRLIGTMNFPLMPLFDPCSRAYLHEIGHQWIQFSEHPSLAGTVPHYPPSTLMTCIMGWAMGRYHAGLECPLNITPEGNGWFRVERRTTPPTFSDMSLYLMGLIPKRQVGTHYFFRNKEYPFEGRQRIASDRFTVADYIAHEGERIPAHNDRASLRFATIVISENGLMSYDEMCYLDWVTRRGNLRTPPPLLEEGAMGQAPDTTTFYFATGKRLHQSTKLGRRRRRELAPGDLPGADIDDIPRDVVNINKASRRDLQRIIHIGPERAEAVVLWRPWVSVKHLVHINGIASSRMRDILDQGLAAV